MELSDVLIFTNGTVHSVISYKYWTTIRYTGRSGNRSTAGDEVILCEKIRKEFDITCFHLRFRFRENQF